MNFFDTQAGYKFTTHTVPALAKSIERLAVAIEKGNEIADHNVQKENYYRNKMFTKILVFARTSECLDSDVVKSQLHALWVAYCIHANYDVDTAPYDNDLSEIWNEAVSVNPLNPFPNYEAFDMYMCKDLV